MNKTEQKRFDKLTDRVTAKFRKCLVATNYNKRAALLLAFDKYNLNTADSTHEQNCWFNALNN